GDTGAADQLEQHSLARRAFGQIGIQINRQVHELRQAQATRKSSSALSRSRKSALASAGVTSSNRTTSLGWSWAAAPRSTGITCAILGYPPIVWQSRRSRIGCSSFATCTVPGATASESISRLFFRASIVPSN